MVEGYDLWANARPRGGGANLSGDHEVLVIQTVKIQILGAQAATWTLRVDQPLVASGGSDSRACVIISPTEVTPLLIRAKPLPSYCLRRSSCGKIHSLGCTGSH